MNLEEFVSNHTLSQVIDIEHSDEQFLAIKKNRNKIVRTYYNTSDNTSKSTPSIQNTYLYLIIQTALVSYQIAGSGPLWRTEATAKIFEDFENIHTLLSTGQSNSDRRLSFLKTSKYNKRIYNIKTSRIEKLFQKYNDNFHVSDQQYISYYQDMESLLSVLSKTMKQPTTAKTITFAIKMFSYAARVIYGELINYPMNIQIPVDSRLIKISTLHHDRKISNTETQKRFQTIAEKHKIPPLHLDSLIRIKYWETIQ